MALNANSQLRALLRLLRQRKVDNRAEGKDDLSVDAVPEVVVGRGSLEYIESSSDHWLLFG